MARRYCALTALLLLAACRSEPPRNDPAGAGRFVARYGPATPEFADFRDGLIAHQFLDTIAARLNDSLRIPRTIVLTTGHCVEPNASYEPRDATVTLCYELFGYLTDLFATDSSREYLVSGTVVFALMHELGHALVDVLSVPITGREEDAVDQLATILLLGQGPAGDSLAFGAVGWLITKMQSGQLDESSFADDHSLAPQRVYNVMCWIYGRDSTRYPQIVEEGWLPEQRRSGCPREYRQLKNSWERLLDPFRRSRRG